MEENNHSIGCGAIKACDQFQLKYPGIVRIVIKTVHQLFCHFKTKLVVTTGTVVLGL
jgi:hypothetical protein